MNQIFYIFYDVIISLNRSMSRSIIFNCSMNIKIRFKFTNNQILITNILYNSRFSISSLLTLLFKKLVDCNVMVFSTLIITTKFNLFLDQLFFGFGHLIICTVHICSNTQCKVLNLLLCYFLCTKHDTLLLHMI